MITKTLYKNCWIPGFVLAAGDYTGIEMINSLNLLKYPGNQSLTTYEDKNHHIWILTAKGINILKDGNGKFTAKLKTREEELWFITKKGITMAHPGRVKLNLLPPPGKIKFKYKLEGYDKDWTILPFGERRMSHYNNLTPFGK